MPVSPWFRRLRPLLSVALWTVAAVALLEFGWLAFFSWAEGSGRLRNWANVRPEKVRVEFASASSRWLGLIEIEHLVVRGRTERGIDWQVSADSARVQVSLLPLLTRRLVVRGAKISGVEVRSVRPAPEAGSERSSRLAASAAMRPLAAPTAAPGAATGARPTRRPRSRWDFEFHHLRVVGVRAIEIDESELEGDVRGEIGFAVRAASGEGEIFKSSVEIDKLTVRHRGAEIASDLDGALELSVAPYQYREERGRALVPYLSGRLRLTGMLDDGPVLEELLRRAPWMAVEPGLDPFTADLRVERGRLRAGSHLEAARAGRTVRALDFTIEGRNALSLVVDRDRGADRARWQLRFDGYTIRRDDLAAPLITGSGLAVAGIARPADLTDLAANTELRLELGEARLPDLAFVSSWLPPGAQIERISGSGTVVGHLAADVAEMRPSGRVEARLDNVQLRWSGLDFTGRLELLLSLTGGDLAARRLELGGTRLLLADFAAPSLGSDDTAAPSKWWMQLVLDEGEIALGPPVAISARFQTRLRDTAPLVALFETKHDLPRWAERLLTEEDVRASGNLRARAGEFELERIDTEFLAAKLSLRLRFAGDERRGKLLLAWRRLAFGVGFDGEEREVRFENAREWFDALP